MDDKANHMERIKTLLATLKQKAHPFLERISRIRFTQKVKEFIGRQDIKARLSQAKEIIISFTKEQPKTAAFIYVCLFCAFSIGFLDEPFALSRLKVTDGKFWKFLVDLNPAGWWFLILIVIWLVYMAVAGLSLTTEAFEKNMIKARAVLFVLLTLSLSSLTSLLLNILTGRYIPSFLDSMNLYGFSAMRFRVSETSFPSFDAQSIWAVAVAAGIYLSRFRKAFYVFAGLVTLGLVLTARCFISDAVMGTYIGIIMCYAAAWIVSENRENFPLISL